MKNVCKDCGHEIVNNNILGLFKKERLTLWLKDQNKKRGDITIYIIYWRKNANDEWLKFPGLFYIGQTKRRAIDRVYGTSASHFSRAFNNPNCSIEHTIKKYGLNSIRAKKIFKVEVLQVVPFQSTKKTTQKLANTIEKFWIGFFHSQFYDFGRNIEPGGSNVYKSIILPFEPLDKALYEASFLQRSGDIERKHYVYNKLGLKVTQNRILDNSLEFWYGFNSNRFIDALRLKRFKIIKNLFEQGYKVAYISKKINADRHDVVRWIENDIYKKRYSGYSYKEIRQMILIKKIINHVTEGFVTPKQLLNLIPGLQDIVAIKHLIRQNLGGWDILINTYAPKIDYWSIAKNTMEKMKKLIDLGKTSEYTAIEFAQTLGSSTIHTSSAIKYIRRKLNTDMTWLEIKKFILTGCIPK